MNLELLPQVILAHTKLQRAIHAGSPWLLTELKNRMNLMGTGLVAVDANPENPEATTLALRSVATLKHRKLHIQMSLSFSLDKVPENCGARATFEYSSKSSTECGGIHADCTFKADGTALWSLTCFGDAAKMEEIWSGLFQVPKGLAEKDILMLVKELSQGFEKSVQEAS